MVEVHANDPIDRLVVQLTGEFPTCPRCGRAKSPGSKCEASVVDQITDEGLRLWSLTDKGRQVSLTIRFEEVSDGE